MINQAIPLDERVVHIRFGGQSRDLSVNHLNIGEYSTDQQVRQALARHLDVSTRKLRPYVVERHSNGNMTLRPEAVFG
ncbi:MAG: hypothetical protein ACPGWR_14470 [Ardenticatenaceae bacterium]